MRTMLFVSLAVALAAAGCGGGNDGENSCGCNVTRNGVSKSFKCGESLCWDHKMVSCSASGDLTDGEACVDKTQVSCFYDCQVSGPSGSWAGACDHPAADVAACEKLANDFCHEAGGVVRHKELKSECYECDMKCRPEWFPNF